MVAGVTPPGYQHSLCTYGGVKLTEIESHGSCGGILLSRALFSPFISDEMPGVCSSTKPAVVQPVV